MQLMDLANIYSGYSFRERISDDPDGDVFVVQVGDLEAAGTIRWQEVLKTRLPRRGRATWLQNGDLLLAAKGSRNGVAVVDNIPGEAICVSNLFIIRVNPDSLLAEFLATYINDGPGRHYIEQAAEGARVQHLRKTALEAMPLTPPVLSQQQHIVALKRAMDDELAVLERLKENRQDTLAAVIDVATQGVADVDGGGRQ